MSVPPDRMAARNPAPMKDPNKIMGLPKWAFFSIIAAGIVLAWYIWKKSKSTNAASLQTANAGTEPVTNGVTAADIGGTPQDNSFATQTDQMALEEQIQALQNSLFQLQQSNGGNGAGLPVQTTGPGGSPGPMGEPTGLDITGTQASGGQPTISSGTPLPPASGIPTSIPEIYPPLDTFMGTPTPTPVVGSGTQTTTGTYSPPTSTPETNPLNYPSYVVNPTLVTQAASTGTLFGSTSSGGQLTAPTTPYVPRLGTPVAS